MMASPGKNNSQGAAEKKLRERLIMSPSDGVGSWTPTSRKDRAASASTAVPTAMATSTMTGWMTLGRMWRHTMRRAGTPTALAASTYSYSLACRKAARITRDVVSHDENAKV